MSSFDTTTMNIYLTSVLALAALALVLSLAVAATGVAHRSRLGRPQPRTRTRIEHARQTVDLRGGGDERVVPAQVLGRCRT